MSTTHFGFESVDEADKARRVRGVFDSVAPKYDVMNDLMSAGLHRAWKAYAVMVANVRDGAQVLDIAGGTGDLSLAFARRVGRSGRVVLTDINESMLRHGRDRLIDAGCVPDALVCDAEKLPFANAQFDVVSVAFGLRNMTHKDVALAEMNRRPQAGGQTARARVLASVAQTAREGLRLVFLQGASAGSGKLGRQVTTPVTATLRSPSACIRARPS
jgi:demethylmenaquinone methyltransferase/2-methoxy-6-polyprenyl-1,4-benzoquinol methylase